MVTSAEDGRPRGTGPPLNRSIPPSQVAASTARRNTEKESYDNTLHGQFQTTYRKALRTIDSWAVDRDIFNREALKIRARFDANKSLDATGGLTARLVREAEAELVDWTHPDPWVNPYMPGGSRFMRNPALPLNIVFPPDLFPEGVPPEYNIAPQDLNYVQLPQSANPRGQTTVLVDALAKKAE